MPIRPTLFLRRDLHAAMVAHARADAPRECCGLVAGPVGGAILRAARYIPLVNAAARPEVEFLSDPHGMFAAVKAMRAAGEAILAVCHSHPTTEAIPSRLDCARNFADHVMNLIISLRSGQARMRGWWLSADGFEEGSWGICGI